jgi:hypothetical protein
MFIVTYNVLDQNRKTLIGSRVITVDDMNKIESTIETNLVEQAKAEYGNAYLVALDVRITQVRY